MRLWDYASSKLLHTARFAAPATAVCWPDGAIDPDGRTIAVGFADGTLRILQRCADGLHLSACAKPHCKPLRHIAYSPDGKMLATGGDDGTIFFLNVAEKYEPIGFVQPAE